MNDEIETEEIDLETKPYTTIAEKKFIDRIGTGFWYTFPNNSKKNRPVTRLELLKRYMAAIKKRFNFNDINEQVAMQYLHEAILKEKRIINNISGQG